MDIVTVVFGPEVEILRWQAASIDRFIRTPDKITVIVNDTIDIADQISAAWWGQHQNKVHIVHRDHFHSKWPNNGWLTQQVLKLLAAAHSTADWCMALDAKSLIMKPLPNLWQGPKIAVGTLPVWEVFEPSRQIVNKLFDIDLRQQLGPGGVPFWFEPSQVRSMIEWISDHTKDNFVDWFLRQGMLTEFILYSGWIERVRGLGNYAGSGGSLMLQNVCHSEVEQFDHKFALMRHCHVASIHRNAWSQLTAQQQNQFQELLNERFG